MEFIFTIACCLLLLPIIAYIIANLTSSDPKPLYGIYAVPGRWFALKHYCMRLLLTVARRGTPHARQRRQNPILHQQHENEMCELDVYSGIGDDPYGHNSFYVNGSNQTGTIRLIARVAIRPNHRRDVWFLLRLPDLGDLVLPQHPHCVVSNVPGDGFSGGGLDCSVIEPLRKWKITYNGPCRVGIRRNWQEKDNRPVVHLRCSFLWCRQTSVYDFATDVHPRLAAFNIAQEKWTGNLFQKLKSMKQCHFEQFGTLEGVVQVDDQEEQEVTLVGVKDRSEGPRRWSDMRSYILNFIVLDNGTFLHVGAFCFPGVLSNLTSGFVIQQSGDVIPAVSVDLPFADLMEKCEDPPMRFSFSVKPEVGENLCIDVLIEDVMYFNMDSDWSVRLREGLSRFIVNGVEGRGVCEILQRYQGGCPVPK